MLLFRNSPVMMQAPFLPRIWAHHYNFPEITSYWNWNGREMEMEEGCWWWWWSLMMMMLMALTPATSPLRWVRSAAPRGAPEPETWPGSTEGATFSQLLQGNKCKHEYIKKMNVYMYNCKIGKCKIKYEYIQYTLHIIKSNTNTHV